ncbi:MAG: hypothetical protein A2Z25_17745 [Planctomycetes bacterium RBG_16_55_9]|nr:MAG: hypothetical protein A2Z25_17745 [Planctomycetes bacterium RBG_16_55_9]
MREILRKDIVRTRDTGLIPEGMFERLMGDKTLYEYAQSIAYPIERIVEVADLAASRDDSALPKLIAACNDPHPVIRYWGATGCLILQAKAAPAKDKLMQLLRDDWMDIRIVAAEALSYLGETETALEVLEPIVKSDQEYISLAALNALDFMQQAGHVSLDRIRQLIGDTQFQGLPARIAEYFSQKTL